MGLRREVKVDRKSTGRKNASSREWLVKISVGEVRLLHLHLLPRLHNSVVMKMQNRIRFCRDRYTAYCGRTFVYIRKKIPLYTEHKRNSIDIKAIVDKSHCKYYKILYIYVSLILYFIFYGT
jgi:hypothetical protein